jgi:5-methylcytosine-specific restriction endonuclease McrA
MLVEDATAFVEQLNVPEDAKQTGKHRRRVARAEVDVVEAQRDVQVATMALQQLERRLGNGVDTAGSRDRRFLRGLRGRTLERDIEKVRAHLDAKRDRLTTKQRRLARIEQRSPQRDAHRQSATTFRLHSEGHYLGCSARRFARLSASQLEAPVLLMRKDGRRWWWYLDRFWWDDERLSVTEVARTVLESDVRTKQRSEADAHARKILLGGSAPITQEHVSESVRLAVWRRDSARCVDCGSSKSVVFDHIVSISQGGSNAAANIELRCELCRARLARNEMRTRVSRARIEAAPYYRDERASA